jgi:hypothetical protein
MTRLVRVAASRSFELVFDSRDDVKGISLFDNKKTELKVIYFERKEKV